MEFLVFETSEVRLIVIHDLIMIVTTVYWYLNDQSDSSCAKSQQIIPKIGGNEISSKSLLLNIQCFNNAVLLL